jgi:hypothetical protein
MDLNTAESISAAIVASELSAASDSRKCCDDLDLIRTHASLYGYEVAADVPRDGNCFFHAVSYHTKDRDSKQLRRELASFLKTKVGIG